MRVYIAGPYEARPVLQLLARDLESVGFTSTARWLGETHDINAGTIGPAAALSDEQVTEHALGDFHDILSADVLVLVTAETAAKWMRNALLAVGSGGRHVETGYALARNLPVFVVGEAENVFHRGVCQVVSSAYKLALALVEHRNAAEAQAAHVCAACAEGDVA